MYGMKIAGWVVKQAKAKDNPIAILPTIIALLVVGLILGIRVVNNFQTTLDGRIDYNNYPIYTTTTTTTLQTLSNQMFTDISVSMGEIWGLVLPVFVIIGIIAILGGMGRTY